jgi:hypothetical protein
MKTIALLAMSVVPLAACNNSPEVHEENASIAEVQNKVAAAAGNESFVRPGRWESKVTVEEMAIPGMSGNMASQMNSSIGQVQTQASCLTPEEAKRPKEDFFAGDDKNCRYDRFNMADGKIDAVMKCSAGGTSHTMTLNGAYTPETYNMRMAMEAGGGDAAAGMRMKMRVDAKRVGECTGKEG